MNKEAADILVETMGKTIKLLDHTINMMSDQQKEIESLRTQVNDLKQRLETLSTPCLN